RLSRSPRARQNVRLRGRPRSGSAQDSSIALRQGDTKVNGRTVVGELYLELAAELIDTFAHRQDPGARFPGPRPAVRTGPSVAKATSLIPNLDQQVAIGSGQRHGCGGARGVTLDVDEALLHHAEETSLHGHRQTPHVADHDFDADAAPLGVARNKP